MNILRVKGSHRDCGIQIGTALHAEIKKEIDGLRASPPSGLSWEGTQAKAKQYLEITQAVYPQIIEEVSGVAAGAGVGELDLFTYMIEELYDSTKEIPKACSDIILTPPKTDGRIIVGHNNDLSSSFRKLVFPVDWSFDDGTSMFTVGPLGFYLSVGVNSFGVALTGNELTPTDNKLGIPRSIIARVILTAKNIDEAIKIATDERRASSYNNIISTKDRVVNIEGSGTRVALTEPQNGSLVHTNHYICESMLQFEGKPNNTSSISRLKHAQKMLEERNGKILTEIDVEKMLMDHDGKQGDDNTICRHEGEYETVFGVTIDFQDKLVRLSMGNPCENKFEDAWIIP